MTEEIIKNEDLKVDVKNINQKQAGSSLIKKLNFKKRRSGSKKPKAPTALGDFELLLVSLTGLVIFGGVIFSLVMIVLMNTMSY